MLIDLESPVYTQAQVLKLIPRLKPKTLQNWAERILDVGEQKPGKQNKRLYTPIGVIMLDFMTDAVGYGIKPEKARDLAKELGAAALEFFDGEPETLDTGSSGVRWVVINEATMAEFRRAFITRVEDDYYIEFEGDFQVAPEHDWGKRTIRSFCILVEVDYRAAMMVNQIALLDAGKLS